MAFLMVGAVRAGALGAGALEDKGGEGRQLLEEWLCL
jgi:hypothetical protein